MSGEGAFNEGTIERGKLWFDDGFTMIPNTWIDDTRLTAGAFRILSKLIRHKPGYKVTLQGLSAGMPHGLDFIRTSVAELERWGYLKRYRRRQGGRFQGFTWQVIDPFRPGDNPPTLPGMDELVTTKRPADTRGNKPIAPYPGEPHAVNPYAGEPHAVKPTTIEEEVNNTSTHLPEVTTEHATEPVDNFSVAPSAPEPQEQESEPLRGAPSGEVSDLAPRRTGSRNPYMAACPGRGHNGPHEYAPHGSVERCAWCGRTPAEVSAPPPPMWCDEPDYVIHNGKPWRCVRCGHLPEEHHQPIGETA